MNFIIENDIRPIPANHTICIKGIVTVECASPALLRHDLMEAKEKFVSVQVNACLLPGEHITVPIPMELRDQKELAIEPHTAQVSSFFLPKIITPVDGFLEIPNETENIITIKKNTQAIKNRLVKEVEITPTKSPHLAEIPSLLSLQRCKKFSPKLPLTKSNPYPLNRSNLLRILLQTICQFLVLTYLDIMIRSEESVPLSLSTPKPDLLQSK
jgi:hypothetical protein